jgi:hypothetical protein
LNQKINIFYNNGERKDISLKNITVDIVQKHLKDIRMKGLKEWEKRKFTPSPPSKEKPKAYAFVRKKPTQEQKNVTPIQGFNNKNYKNSEKL